jgi:hypothetical protein
MELSEMQRLKAFEDENRRLKPIRRPAALSYCTFESRATLRRTDP